MSTVEGYDENSSPFIVMAYVKINDPNDVMVEFYKRKGLYLEVTIKREDLEKAERNFRETFKNNSH